MAKVSRRNLVTASAVLGLSMSLAERGPRAAERELSFDFTRPLDGWQTVSGRWAIEDLADARTGRALFQRAT